MNKTALTVFIETIDEGIKGMAHLDAPNTKEMAEVFKQAAITLLLKEREDIERAHYLGLIETGEEAKWPLDKKRQYFDTTFTQYNPKPTP